MNQFLKVEGHSSLVRDKTTGAILNNNRTEYEEYLDRKRKAEAREAEISQHTEDINNIKNELQDIKGLLLQLLSNK
jgi:phage terminase large subunit-like protein